MWLNRNEKTLTVLQKCDSVLLMGNGHYATFPFPIIIEVEPLPF